MHTILFRVLAMLRDEPSDAAALLTRLAGLASGSPPSLPAFYRHLRRGMEEGWIVVEGIGEADEGPGRPPQVYRLTAPGEAAMREVAREMRVFTDMALQGGSDGRE